MSAPSRGHLLLVVRAPNGDVREIEIGGQALVIGRDESADIRVDDRKVSRRHASFRLIDGEAWVEDLGSSNGVRLNEEKIDKRAKIGLHDEVRVGGFKMCLKQLGATEAGPPKTAALAPGSTPRAPEGSAAPATHRPRIVERGPPETSLPRLYGLDAPVKGQQFGLRRGENVVGRLEECDVPILDGSVSRKHARIVFSQRRLTVTDLGSSNGVFVNDLRVEAAELAEGDTLRIGQIGLKVRMPADLASKVSAPLSTRARARRVAPDRRWLTMGGTGLVLAVVVLVVALAVQARRDRAGEGASPYWATGEDPVGTASVGLAGRTRTVEGFDEPWGADPALAGPPSLDPGAPPVASAGSSPPAAPVPASTSGPGRVSPAVVSDAITRTATSPYTRRGPDGLPLDLPQVDPSFDFERFVADKLERAKTCEAAGDLPCVREQVSALLNRDPINGEGRALLDRVRKTEAAEAAMAEADRHAARGDNAMALRVLNEAPADGPRAGAVRRRAEALKERAISEELTAAAREAGRRRSWKRAHRRYKYVLELDPHSRVALEGLRTLEQRMRRRRIAFSAYRPPSREAPRSGGESTAIRRQFSGDERLIAVAKAYARGALDEAARQAKRLSRRAGGGTAVTAKAIGKAIAEVEKRYERTRTEISNDPDQAWAMLIDLERFERRILPGGLKSFVVRELEVDLSEAFAERGRSLFDGGRYEDAFQRWESGYKLDPTNPKALAGLKRLEEQAEAFARDAELAAQRGDDDACSQWKRITRMTRSEALVHQRARQRAFATCR